VKSTYTPPPIRAYTERDAIDIARRMAERDGYRAAPGYEHLAWKIRATADGMAYWGVELVLVKP
jgi:hypothetical protein